MIFISRTRSGPGQGSGRRHEGGCGEWISNGSIMGERHHIFCHVKIWLHCWHSLCRYCEPLTWEQQSTSEATRFFLQQPKSCNIAADIPICSPIPQPLAPGGASYTVEGGGTSEGPRALTALPAQIPPAQHPPAPHLFEPHKWSVSAPHSLVANATGVLRLWGVSCAADDPPYVTAAFTQTPDPEQLRRAPVFQRGAEVGIRSTQDSALFSHRAGHTHWSPLTAHCTGWRRDTSVEPLPSRVPISQSQLLR